MLVLSSVDKHIIAGNVDHRTRLLVDCVRLKEILYKKNQQRLVVMLVLCKP